jgi:phage-related protein
MNASGSANVSARLRLGAVIERCMTPHMLRFTLALRLCHGNDLAPICHIWHNQNMSPPFVKPLVWVGSSLKDLREFPETVKDEMGFALYVAQCGLRPPDAKPLKGFGGAGVLEVVSDYRTGTYRAVYTVSFGERVYVLYAFQKKSKKGSATSKADIEMIKRRLRQAEALHEAWRQEQAGGV